MEGDLREFTLPEILQFVSIGSRTGVLEVLRRDGVYRINFTSGVITGLNSDGWSVTQALEDAALLSQAEIDQLLAASHVSQDIRSLLLTDGTLTAEDWTAFVARQVEHLLYTLFDVTEGKFRFRQGTTHSGPWLQVRISADRAVLEGTRWSETWQRAEGLIPNRQTRFVRSGQLPNQPLSLSMTQWRVFIACERPGTVEELATRGVLSETEVVESLQALVSLLLIRQLPTATSPSRAVAPTSRQAKTLVGFGIAPLS